MEISTNEKSRLVKVALVLMIIVSVYFLAKTVSEIKGYRFIGGGATASNTISFDGTGEISASPDLATVSFTIREEAKDMKEAQTKATTKETAGLNFLEKSRIDKKDIKTENYSTYPKYEWRQSICPQPLGPSSAYYCPPGKDVLTGYEVSEYISVKVHDLAKAGDIVKGIVDAGISEISGPDFSIEKEDQLKEQARKMAIDKAKAKAETLASDLGVHLVRIVSFSENGNYPMPMYAKDMMAGASVENAAAPAPTLPTGENKITSTVTITYEIR